MILLDSWTHEVNTENHFRSFLLIKFKLMCEHKSAIEITEFCEKIQKYIDYLIVEEYEKEKL